MYILALVVAVFTLTNWEKTDNLIKDVNSKQSLWVAGHNKFSHLSFEEKQARHSCVTGYKDTKTMRKGLIPIGTTSVPDSFDSRTEWPDCKSIANILDQQQCGSCWAFAGTESLSDRFCIKENVQVQLSPQDLVSCDYSNMGCDGGSLGTEWSYMKKTGVVSWKCEPYNSGNGTTTPCPVNCVDGTPRTDDKYFAKSYKHVGWFPVGRVEAIEKEIVDNGPVEVAFTVYEDFYQYTSGVYVHTSGAAVGGHAVKNIGYGVTSSGENSGTKYWIIANSWGSDWGMDGFFWIKKGDNQCGIEADCYAGEPGNHP